MKQKFRYGHAKQALFELILEKFTTQRERFNYFMENKQEIEKELQKGAESKSNISKCNT